MFDHRVVRNAVGRRDVAPCGQPHAAAPPSDRNHPGAARSVAVVFEFLDQWLGIGVAPQRDHGLHGIRDVHGGRDLGAGNGIKSLQQGLERREGLGVPTQRNLEKSEARPATPQVAVSRTAGRWSGRQRQRIGTGVTFTPGVRGDCRAHR